MAIRLAFLDYCNMTLEQLDIEPTQTTPSIHFDASQGLLSISGVSTPENITDFYSPVISWLRDYICQPAENTTLALNFDYFNTGTSKILLEFFTILERLYDQDQPVSVLWYYPPSDIDSLEAAEDYAQLIRLPIKTLPRN